MKFQEEQIKEKLTAFRGWEYQNGQLEKTYSFSSFGKAVEFVNKVAVLAESLDHHPDIIIRYNKVICQTSSHDVQGITERDFKLIKEIEKIAVVSI